MASTIIGVFLVAGAAIAGGQPTQPVPMLGDAGLLVLGLGLVGGGVAAMRRRRS